MIEVTAEVTPEKIEKAARDEIKSLKAEVAALKGELARANRAVDNFQSRTTEYVVAREAIANFREHFNDLLEGFQLK